MLNQNLPYWQQQQAVQARMKAAEDAARTATEAREAVKGMSVAINRQPSFNAANYGAIDPYTPPVFDPRLGGLAVESCQKNGGYCVDTDRISKEAIAKATVEDRLAYDKSVAAKIAANFERNKPLNQRLKEAADAAAAAAAAEVQKAAANSLPNLIANAVATGKCNSPSLVNTAIFQSGACQDYRDPQRKAIKDAMIADNKKKSDLASKKLADALTNKKAAVEKVKKPPAKLKAKEKAKKAFAKGIAKIKKQNRRR